MHQTVFPLKALTKPNQSAIQNSDFPCFFVFFLSEDLTNVSTSRSKMIAALQYF